MIHVIEKQDTRKTTLAAAFFLGFILVAVLANIVTARFGLVPVGFGFVVTAGTFFAGAALVLRDGVHETLGVRYAYLAVLIGALLSVVTANPAIALASGVAFAASETIDATVYAGLRSRSRALAVAVSGAVALVVDTVLFLWIAGFPLTTGVLAGQFIIKGGISLLAAGYLAAKDRG